MDTDVVFHDKTHGSWKNVSSASIPGVGVTHLGELPRLIHGVDLSCPHGSNPTFTTLVLIHEGNFSHSYLYEFHCMSMYNVLETLRDAFKYGFYAVEVYGYESYWRKQRRAFIDENVRVGLNG